MLIVICLKYNNRSSRSYPGYQIVNLVGTQNKIDEITIIIKENIRIRCIYTAILFNCCSSEIDFKLYDK